jgi:hypothetical protein
LREHLMHKKIPDFKESVSQLDERDGGCRIGGNERGVVARCRLTYSSRKAPLSIYSEYCFAQYLELRCNNELVNI